MTNISLEYSTIEQKIKGWASATLDIQAVFILGSRGSKVDPPRGADLDLLIITSKPEKYRDGNLRWCSGIDDVVLGQFQPDTHMIYELSSDYILVFNQCLDVDFSFISLGVFKRELLLADLFIRVLC